VLCVRRFADVQASPLQPAWTAKRLRRGSFGLMQEPFSIGSYSIAASSFSPDLI
jgi:hypothetical protein